MIFALLPLSAMCVVLSRSLNIPISQGLLAAVAMCLLPTLCGIVLKLRRDQMQRSAALVRLSALVLVSIGLAASSRYLSFRPRVQHTAKPITAAEERRRNAYLAEFARRAAQERIRYTRTRGVTTPRESGHSHGMHTAQGPRRPVERN
jgi:hypothetical protein